MIKLISRENRLTAVIVDLEDDSAVDKDVLELL